MRATRLPAIAATLALSLTSGCHHRAHPSPVVYTTDEQGGDVLVVDPVAARVTARIAVGKRPRGLKVSPDGKRLYIALSGSPRSGPGVDTGHLPPADRSADGVAVVDLATRAVRTLAAGQDPDSLELSADGSTLYVSNGETSELTVVDTTSGAIRGNVAVGKEPEGVTLRPDGKVVLVAAEGGGEITAVDTTSLAVVAHIPTGPKPRAVVFANDGRTAFVTDEGGAKVTVIDAVAFTATGDISITEDSPMPSGPRPMGAALSPDGAFLYVTCGRGGSVAVIDVASRKQVRSIDGVGDRPWGVSVSADGKRLYTANGTSNDLSIVDVATGNVEKRVHIGGLPWGVVTVTRPRPDRGSSSSSRSKI